MVNPNTRLQAFSIPSSALALHFARKIALANGAAAEERSAVRRAAQRIRQAVKNTVRGTEGQ